MNNLSKKFEYMHFSDDQLRSKMLSKDNINLLANLFVNKAKLTSLRDDQKNDFLSFIKKLNYHEFNKSFNGINKIEDINNKIISLYFNRLNTKKETTDTHISVPSISSSNVVLRTMLYLSDILIPVNSSTIVVPDISVEPCCTD
jgi:hypothetical protein